MASLGATIIKIAEARGRKILDAILPDSDDPAGGIKHAMTKLDKVD